MSCIFCEIVAGKKEAYKVFEDDQFLAFLDNRPLTRGNTLVIPKKHYRWVDDVPEFGDYFEVARKIGLAAKKVLGAKWISYITLGLGVAHAHIRVVPRYPDDLHEELPVLGRIESLTEGQMRAIAEALTKALQ
jgi:histidine triad (HIT) family protein